MARAALQWSLDETAKAAGVSYRTIFRFENEQRDIQSEKVAAIRRRSRGRVCASSTVAAMRAGQSRRRCSRSPGISSVAITR